MSGRWELQPNGTWVNGVGTVLPHDAFPVWYCPECGGEQLDHNGGACIECGHPVIPKGKRSD